MREGEATPALYKKPPSPPLSGAFGHPHSLSPKARISLSLSLRSARARSPTPLRRRHPLLPSASPSRPDRTQLSALLLQRRVSNLCSEPSQPRDLSTARNSGLHASLSRSLSLLHTRAAEELTTVSSDWAQLLLGHARRRISDPLLAEIGELISTRRLRLRESEMDGWVRALVEAIHSSPTQAVVFLAGGASQALGWLMSVPGASNTILEVVVPYSKTSMIQLLGKIPERYTSQQMVEEMAILAYNRALKLSGPDSVVVGVGFTGSLASARPKFGYHRFYLSTRTCDRRWTSSITLTKGMRTREEEDRISSHFLLKAIADACKVSATFTSDLHESEVPTESENQFDEDQELQQIIDGELCMKIYNFSSDKHANSERKIILSGSFNPLHDGHLRLMDIASSICEGFPCFEISAINADKPPLEVVEIKRRVEQFKKAGKTVIISNQPYFYRKAELFPGCTFVIGADTAVRLINPKYYGGYYGKMLEILLGCKNSGCKFLVGGRMVDGVFKVLEDFDIPDELEGLFISIPEDRFRLDISSTEMRNSRDL